MDATATTTVTLAEFNPSYVWYTSHGAPAGQSIDLLHGEDENTGETYDLPPGESDDLLPAEWWDLEGTVSADGKLWQWDGKHADPENRARDWRQNTLTDLAASHDDSCS